MLIHDHSERVGTTTAQASGTIAPEAGRTTFTTTEVCVCAVGWLLLGLLASWAVASPIIARARRQRDRFERRWMRSNQRYEQAKQVIARMVEQESEDRRRHSAVA
jgi:hypothetical protein